LWARFCGSSDGTGKNVVELSSRLKEMTPLEDAGEEMFGARRQG
jgi:hypothetical protein